MNTLLNTITTPLFTMYAWVYWYLAICMVVSIIKLVMMAIGLPSATFSKQYPIIAMLITLITNFGEKQYAVYLLNLLFTAVVYVYGISIATITLWVMLGVVVHFINKHYYRDLFIGLTDIG